MARPHNGNVEFQNSLPLGLFRYRLGDETEMRTVKERRIEQRKRRLRTGAGLGTAETEKEAKAEGQRRGLERDAYNTQWDGM